VIPYLSESEPRAEPAVCSDQRVSAPSWPAPNKLLGSGTHEAVPEFDWGPTAYLFFPRVVSLAHVPVSKLLAKNQVYRVAEIHRMP